MQAHHHIVGSESLDRRRFAPGYGAIHKGVGLRHRRHFNLTALGTWAVLVMAGLSLVGVLTGTAP
jgi:hypothetical protein